MKQSIAALPILVFLFLAVTFIEFLDTSACLDVTLTSREERMALGANINTKLFFRRTRLERVAAATDYCSLMIFRMNTFFHVYTPHFSPDWEIIQALYAKAWTDLASHCWGKASRFLHVGIPRPPFNNYSTANMPLQAYRKICLKKYTISTIIK